MLIVGNDLVVYVSVDDGTHWTRWQTNLPTVPVHDLTIHPRENDLVLATYGRALWVGNMQPLRELSAETLARPAFLFEIRPAARYAFGTQGTNYALGGDKYLRVPNEPEGVAATYWLSAEGSPPARISVSDASGAVAREVTGPSHRGLNHVVIPFAQGGGRGRGGAGGTGLPGSGRGGRGDATLSGTVLVSGSYTVTLEAGGLRLTRPAVVRERIS